MGKKDDDKDDKKKKDPPLKLGKPACLGCGATQWFHPPWCAVKYPPEN